MYFVKKQYKGKKARHYLAKPFKGKKVLYLDNLTDEEAEHLYKNKHPFIAKEEAKDKAKDKLKTTKK
jgi:hypothetical protein